MAVAAALTREESMAYEYKTAPEPKTPLSLRVPVTLKERLEVLVRLWKAQATAKNEDGTNIDVTFVSTALLRDAVSAAFELFGGYPTDEAAIAKLEKAIREGTVVAKDSK